MSKLLQAFRILFISGLILSANAQTSFETGKMAVELDNFGQIEIFAPNLDTIQVDRASLLVGTAPNAVYDYLKDAESVMPVTLVGSPQLSDFELTVWCNNTYSNLPPAVTQKMHVYGWNNAGYVIFRMRVINNEASTLNAYNGLEILPQINAEYGNETVQYLADGAVIAMYKSQTGRHVGFRFFDPELASLKTFEWFGGFNDVDDSLWNWLTYGQIAPLYTSGLDGSVAIPSLAPVNIASGDSVEFFFGVAVGDNQGDMMMNMIDAYDKYVATFTGLGISLKDPNIPTAFELRQNYPNPFNPVTKIDFQIAEKRAVSLKIFNIIGQEVATLVDGELTPGSYSYDFQANNLPSGVYFYTLIAGDFKETRKMMLMK